MDLKQVLQKKLRQLVGATKATTRHVLTGAHTLTPERVALRLEVCRICERYRPATDGCTECGCEKTLGFGGLSLKASWASEDCPHPDGSRWPRFPRPLVELAPPDRSTRIPSGLNTQPAGYAFNASFIRYRGRLLLAYRTGWAGSQVHVAGLDPATYAPGPSVTLALTHPRATYGREDPRLFVHRDRLHVSFTGVEPAAGGGVVTNQLYARLTDDLRVEEVFYPHYAGRASWEKNWSFFEWSGNLFAVYSIRPHLILHIVGDRAYPFAETPNPHPWGGGHLRGGAPPVLAGGELWHWFHGRTGSYYDARYNVGLYAFEPKPPFRILRMTPEPLQWDDPATKGDNYCPVLFVAGALLDGDRWLVSCGVNDRWIEIREWAAASAAAALAHTLPAEPPAP